MKANSNFRSGINSSLFYAGILIAGTIGYILLSPKWTMPIFAWIAPACMLFYFRHATVRFKILWFISAFLLSEIIGSYGVAPFPLPVLIVVDMIEIVKILLVFMLDKWASKRASNFIVTLVFPAAFVSKEFLDTVAGGNVFYSIANTQYGFTSLAQLSSVTGLAGITFLVYWFAAVTVWCMEKYFNQEKFLKGVLTYTAVFASVMIFGFIHLTTNTTNGKTVKVAGLSVPSFNLLENLYKDVNHKTVVINPKISVVSKEMQQVNAAVVPFIENPEPSRFENGYKAMYKLHDSLFALSQQAADAGAKIIAWSEANALMPKSLKDGLIQRGEAFAEKNKVYLLMTLGVFSPGKITPGRMFLENVAIFVGPNGRILNVFHKNHPVPIAEKSAPGNGKIPAIATPYGVISPSICYDADIPSTMRQLGKNKTDMLLLPSGDWYDISPYHSYMAAFRGIENGCTVVRPKSGGLSLVTDYRGKVQTAFDFYQPGPKLWITNIQTGHISTIYSAIGDAFAYACIIFTALSILFLVARKLAKRKSFLVSELEGGRVDKHEKVQASL